MAILSRQQVASYAQGAGFNGDALQIAVAIAQAESGFDPSATHRNSNGSTDYGLWQINSAHDYNPSQLLQPAYNAQAAFAISRNGNDFAPWTTFVSGAYKQYLQPTSTSQATQKVKSATANGYPKGQCTWWASERYHALTGYYIPWSANAKDWPAGATANGWQVSAQPHIPSIIALQPNVQGADPMFGHVAIAERMNKDGSVHCSTQNWNNITYPNVTYWDFKPGDGVQFIFAGSGTVSPGGSSSSGSSSPGFTSTLQQVHNTLVDTPGFYGMALAIDSAEQFTGWVDLTDHSGGGFLGWLSAAGGFDVVGYTRSIGATISDNILPFSIRAGLVTLGSILLIFLLARLALGIAENNMQMAQDIAPLLETAAAAA